MGKTNQKKIILFNHSGSTTTMPLTASCEAPGLGLDASAWFQLAFDRVLQASLMQSLQEGEKATLKGLSAPVVRSTWGPLLDSLALAVQAFPSG